MAFLQNFHPPTVNLHLRVLSLSAFISGSLNGDFIGPGQITAALFRGKSALQNNLAILTDVNLGADA